VGLRRAGLLLVFLSSLQAAPMLRLVSSTVGPVSLAVAGPANTQTMEAYNAGDGALSLSFGSSVTWVTAALGAPRNCTTTQAVKTCLTIQFNINSAGLPAGVSTGIVTVSDPNAVDAPQTVAVVVRVGPVDAYVAPGGSRTVPFAASSFLTPKITTQDGGKWLSMALDGTGSFRFSYSYPIRLTPPGSMAAGNYNGGITTSGATNPTDNQVLPVVMRVTTQPIGEPLVATTFAPQPAPDRVSIRLAQGAPALAYPFSPVVLLNNAGQGTLTVTDTATNGAWLKKDVVPGFFAIDPAGLSPGSNSGSVVFTSNAANGTVTVPVDLTIVPKGNPIVYYQGVLDNGTFVPGDTVAQGDVMAVKGEQLSFSPYTPGQLPLATQLGGTSVLVNGKAAPLFYTSYGQIAFQMPVETPVGTALVQVKRDDGSTSNQASVTVGIRAPRLIVAVNQDFSINGPDHPAHVGEALTIYAIGLGATSPAVATGALAPSAEPLARVTPTPDVVFGAGLFATNVAPAFAGLTPGAAGLYQVNVIVPDGTPKGASSMAVAFSDALSNALTLYVQ
jgi:uncharacterized protein (TIGR03437 family)